MTTPGKRGNEFPAVEHGQFSLPTISKFLKVSFFKTAWGEVAEWSNVPDSKSGVPQGTAGSNPALSAITAFAAFNS
ncbi:uncharacterized protein METZ01_LOCUS381548 [marine metagenome]|uniref:Uncharacterized protein n=1 Tax=marine metagenome TaxID=408172 RepID=A0A382U316_9ZZZZ